MGSSTKKLEPRSPEADYGLRNNDGFDPTKYDFYNPSYRTAGKALVVHVDEKEAATYTGVGDPPEPQPDPYDHDSPSPLSPIEEIDDDLSAPPSNRNSNQMPPRPGVAGQPTMSDEYSLDQPEGEKDIMKPLEQRAELLFSRQHLQLILADPKLSISFTDFLRTYRPDTVQILAYYLDVIKALKTIKYAESIIHGIEPVPGHEFTTEANSATMAWVLDDKADRALDILAKDDLPAFIAYVYVRTVDVALVDRVTGREGHKSHDIADGLAEVFVLSDPAKPDNPILFTSEEFHKMTGYPRNEFLGRNCRVLGGPKTNPLGVSRLRASLNLEREHCEVLLNYRKDGTPFINLIMCVPLRDQSGKVRYYLGAQLDITNLVNDCIGLETLNTLVQRHNKHSNLVRSSDDPVETIQKDEFEQLSETLSPQELEKLIKLRQSQQAESEEKATIKDFAEQLEKGPSSRSHLVDLENTLQVTGEGSAPPLGYYKTYLLVRPAPSLRILFASPDLRTPGVLQSPLLDRIGGSTRVRNHLANALEVGRKVTAKVQWLSDNAPKPRARWMHCTPLLGINDAIGVWMVILVDDEIETQTETKQKIVEPLGNSSSLGSTYTAQAVPWDTGRQTAHITGVSTTIWSGRDDVEKSSQASRISQPKKHPFLEYSESAEAMQSPVVVRPGPRIAGKAYSYTSSNDGQITPDDKNVASNDKSRPSSSSSSVLTPMQTSMQPRVKIAGRPSIDSESTRKLPVNMPYRRSIDRKEDGEVPIRRTYKSLSPYGILFED
ncbi:hypothetical protein ACLMJK_004174 [Lecanora helva]